MTLTKRERNLAIVAGLPLACMILWYGYDVVASPFIKVKREIEAKQKELDGKTQKEASLKNIVEPLDEFHKRALPMEKDAELGRTLYKLWLAKLAEKSGFEKPQLTLGQASGPRGAGFVKLPYTLRVRGSLSQVTKFLHSFYSSGNLHIISKMTLKPLDKSRDIEALFQIEALAMTEADRKTALSTAPGRTLALPDLAAYRKKIEDRDVFAAYKPPKPRKDTPTPVDPSKYAFVTGIVGVDGQLKVWLKSRTTDESLQLAEGESFRIGDFQGKIGKIVGREVEIESDKKRRTVSLGDPICGDNAQDKRRSDETPTPADAPAVDVPEGSTKADSSTKVGKPDNAKIDASRKEKGDLGSTGRIHRSRRSDRFMVKANGGDKSSGEDPSESDAKSDAKSATSDR